MKKLKQFLTLLLALLLLAGCAVTPKETDASETEQTGASGIQKPTTPDHPFPTLPKPSTVLYQALPETVDNPDNLPVLRWVCLTNCIGGWARTWSEDAVIELNQMLADRNLPFRLQLLIYSYDIPATESRTFFEDPEVQAALRTADIIYGSMSGDEARKLLMPITEYVTGSAKPSLKNAVPHEAYWRFATLDNEIYGVTTFKAYPTSPGWHVDKSLMQEVGLTDADFQKQFWEMDDVFAKIDEKVNGPFLRGESDTFSVYTYATSGVIQDFGPGIMHHVLRQRFSCCGSVFGIDEETGQVVNIMDTEFSRNLQQAVNRYTKLGYMGKSLIDFGTVRGSQSGDKIAYKNGRAITIGHALYNANENASLAYINGVAKNSKLKEEALTLLQLVAEDEEFMMQLAYGKEGRDYTIDEDGYYHMVTREDGSNYSMSHLALLSCFTDIEAHENEIGTINPGPDHENDIVYEGKTLLESHQQMWDEAEKRYLVVFDYTGFDAERAAIEQVCKKYFTGYSTMTPEKYDQMIADFNAAGADRILASLQKQYDQWKKDNPDKVR